MRTLHDVPSKAEAYVQHVFSTSESPKPSQYIRPWYLGFMNRRRFWIATALWALQALYFPINRIVGGDRNLSIKAIDGRMPRISIFALPYAFGFVYLGSISHVAATLLSKKFWQEHVIGLIITIFSGFTIWLLFPAKVIKRPFEPNAGNIFDKILKAIHVNDKTYGQYNSFPSSHVYYVNVGLHYLEKQYPRHRWFFQGSIIINALSTVLTHQHYVIDVVAGFALSETTTRLADHIITPKLRAKGLLDALDIETDISKP